MENDLYITQLPGVTTSAELSSFLEEKLKTKCGVTVKAGKIKGTSIAFCSVGGHDIDDAIQILQFIEFKGRPIKVQRYKVTDKNRKFQPEKPYSMNKESKQSNMDEDATQSSIPAANGCGQGPTTHTGVMVHLDSADEFYVQVQEDLNFLQMISSHLTLGDVGRLSPVENPIIGEMYAAQYSVDHKYYRAILLSDVHDDKAAVRFVDFGSFESVNANTLTKIDQDIAELNYVAKRCRFHGVKILNPQKAKQILQDAGEQFVIHRYSESVTEDNFKLWEVDLLDLHDRSLRDQIIESGAFEATSENIVVNCHGDDIGHKSPSDMNGDMISPSTNCIITHVESVDKFYIQGAYDKAHLQRIYECLMDADDYTGIKTSDALPNQIYGAKFSLDGKWYRCTVKSSRSDGFVAAFVDFGNYEVLSSVLKQLPDDVAALKPQAICCQLQDVKVIEPEAVKVTLEQLVNSETTLKCQIQKGVGDAPASIDFGVENSYRSFCSHLIERRLAERVYQRSPPRPQQSHLKMIPPQVIKRSPRGSPVNPKPLMRQQPAYRKRESHPRPSSNDMAAQRTSITPLMNQSNGDKNSVVVEVIDEGIVREKVLSEITDMIESSFESRIKVMKWRAILGVHHPNDEATPESLFERLDRLKNLSGIGDSSDEGEDSAATVHRKLIGLRKRVMDNKTAFYTILSELEGRLSGGELDENEITTKADERDRLAEILVQNVESFITALSSNTEIVQKRISEIKEMAFDIDFLLSMCPSSETLEDDPEIESRGRELWTKFASSDELRRLTEATDQASVRMDSSRQAFGFITGALGLEATKLGSQSVKSFFPNLDSLNKAMKNELEAYKRQLVSGQQGKITSACLSRFNKCISGLVLELNNLETDKYAMTEYNHKASEILSARSVMTEDTIESMEMTSQQMKKIRSRLRHHLADLEDLMENDEESEEVQECRKSIEEIRQELHAVLKDTMKQKEFVTQALSMRPELSLNLVRLLKSAGPSMCDSDSIISWETFYFDMKPMNTGKTRYASRFGDEDVIIKKILVTDDGERLRTQIKAYQEAVSLSDSCLLPIIAAFVPPKESLVLYLIFPSYASCDAPTDTADYLKHVLGFLSGFRSLRKAGLPCVYNFPLSHLVKVNGRSQPLLKPSAFLEASTSTTDFIGIIRSLKTTAANAKVERFLVEEIFHDANSAEDIDIVISRISNLLKDEALTGTLELEEKPDQLFTVCEPPATTSYDEELMDIKEEIKEEF